MAAADLSADDISSAISSLLTESLVKNDDDYYSLWVSTLYPLKSEVVYNYEGQSYRQAYTVNADGTVQLTGDAIKVQRVTRYEPVSMSASVSFSESPTGDLEWEGVIFEAGSYPDKGVDVTIHDLDRWVTNSVGAGWKVQHIATPFDKALQGYGIKRLWRDGRRLYAKVSAPSWMGEALKDVEKKVSVGLAPDLGKIDELSIVNFPRVEIAAVFAGYAQFAGKRHSSTDEGDIQSIHDLAVTLGATCKGPEMAQNQPPEGPANKKMPLTREALEKVFGKVDADVLKELGISSADLDSVTFAAPKAPPIHPDVQAQLDAITKQNAAFAASRVEDAAYQFADQQLRDKKILTSMRDTTAAQYRLALTHDGGGSVKFSTAGAVEEGENVKALREHYKNAPAHTFFTETIPGQVADDKNGVSDEMRRKYFSATPEGRQLLEVSK